MFSRADFMSITCVTMGIYAVQCPEYFRRRDFRILVLTTLLSFFYDLIFLFGLHDAKA